MEDKKMSDVELLKAGKAAVVLMEDRSMEPLIIARETFAIIEPLRKPLQVGDMAAGLDANGQWLIRRVLRVESEGYSVCGDRRMEVEKRPKEWVEGRVITLYRKKKMIFITDKKYRLYEMTWMALFILRHLPPVLFKKVKHLKKKR